MWASNPFCGASHPMFLASLYIYYIIFTGQSQMATLTLRNHWEKRHTHQNHFVPVKTLMISSTYATYTEGKVAIGTRFTYTYRHVNEVFFLFFKLFFFFFIFFHFILDVGKGSTTPPPPVHVAECKSHATCREMCAGRYTRYTHRNFRDFGFL